MIFLVCFLFCSCICGILKMCSFISQSVTWRWGNPFGFISMFFIISNCVPNLWLIFMWPLFQKMFSKSNVWHLWEKLCKNHKLEWLFPTLPIKETQRVLDVTVICPLFHCDHNSPWALGPYFDYASIEQFYEFLLDFKRYKFIKFNRK